MKSWFFAATFLVAMTPLVLGVGAAAQQAAAPEQDIPQLLREWDEAYRQRNVQRLSRILADDFTLTDARGAVLNKSQYLMSIVKSPDSSRVKSFASEDVRIHIDGNIAEH